MADAVYIVKVEELADAVTWVPALPSADSYQVYAKWIADETRATDALYRVVHDGGTAAVSVNQRVGSGVSGGGQWHYLGSYAFDPLNGPMVTLAANDNGSVTADAVRFVGGPGGATDIAYLHSDHLGAPQVMTDANAQVLWWRDQTPFGQMVAEGGFSVSLLRFPGQYADAESGLAYNYFRDYDPALGRYIQSDPIGLGGGLNTYGYVGGNPLRYTDPTGQFFFLIPIAEYTAVKLGADIVIGAAISAGLEYYCTGRITAQGVLVGAILGPIGRVIGGRAWALASRYVPGVHWAGEAVGRGAGALGSAAASAWGRTGGVAAEHFSRLPASSAVQMARLAEHLR